MIGFGNGSERFGWPRRHLGPVYGDGGMVASAHPLIMTTALEVLHRGDNTVDAAVAAAIAASVVMPEMCGLGGDLFAIVHDPANGKTLSLLGSGFSPRDSTIEQMRGR